jgi:hypothetical protein
MRVDANGKPKRPRPVYFMGISDNEYRTREAMYQAGDPHWIEDWPMAWWKRILWGVWIALMGCALVHWLVTKTGHLELVH